MGTYFASWEAASRKPPVEWFPFSEGAGGRGVAQRSTTPGPSLSRRGTTTPFSCTVAVHSSWNLRSAGRDGRSYI